MGYQFNPFTGNFDLAGAGGGSTSPGGSDTQIQFNDDGDFGGSADLTWDDTGKVLGVGGDIDLDDGGTYTTTLQTITPTAARTISFPDATGTVALVGGSSGNLVVNQSGAYAGVANSSVDNATGNITLGSRFISSLNGALSATGIAGVPVAVTGTWIAAGGTATTTKPQVLIEPTGATSTAWSTAGTGLGVNAASGFTGNLLDLQVNGTSCCRVAANGNFALPNSTFGANGFGVQYTTGGFRLSVSSAQGLFIQGSGGGTGSPRVRGDEGYYGWSSDSDSSTALSLVLTRDAANTLAQRNGTNAQTFRVYNTFTSATNFERLNVRWTSNEAILDTEAGSAGGTLRGLKIGSASTSLLGFYGAAPAVQPTAVANITTTATAGTLPTPDGTVTIADADAPTVGELLEYCVELESKLEAALGHLRTLGLIAT